MVKTYLIAADIHIPHHDIPALSCFLKSCNHIQPDGIILLGDIGDFSTFCSHDVKKYPKKTWNEETFLEKSEHDYEDVNYFLDLLEQVAPKSEITYAMGNHEDWVRQYIEKNPQARHNLFNINLRLRFANRGYIVKDYNEVFKIGKLCLIHGMYHNQAHAKKHLQVFSRSVMYGHVHDFQIHSRVTIDKDSHMAWSLPCLCNRNPDYLKTKANNWNLGFAIVYVWPNGEFQVSMVRIQEGKCVVHGKEIISLPHHQ